MFVYLIQNLETSNYKIGVSKNPNKRLKQLQTASGEELKLVATFETTNARKVESALHNQYSPYKTQGEWFNISLVEEVSFGEICSKIDENITYLRNNGNIFI